MTNPNDLRDNLNALHDFPSADDAFTNYETVYRYAFGESHDDDDPLEMKAVNAAHALREAAVAAAFSVVLNVETCRALLDAEEAIREFIPAEGAGPRSQPLFDLFSRAHDLVRKAGRGEELTPEALARRARVEARLFPSEEPGRPLYPIPSRRE